MKKVVTKTKDLLNINKKEEESNLNYENKQNEVYPFEGSNNKVIIDQPEARVSSSLDEPDFGNNNQFNNSNKKLSQQDILDEINNPNYEKKVSNEKKEEINNFFKDDNQKTTGGDNNKFEYPKYY